MSQKLSEGSMSLYLELLRAESGISSEVLERVRRRPDEFLAYHPRVRFPGRVVRDFNSGSPISEAMTGRQWLLSVGIEEVPESLLPNEWERYAVKVVNALGFRGVQFGESAMTALGLYVPVVVNVNGVRVPRYYDYVFSDSVWAGGVVERLCRDEHGTPKFMCTDVNRWDGEWTGRIGVFHLSDLCDVSKHLAVACALWAFNVRRTFEYLRVRSSTCLLESLEEPCSVLGRRVGFHVSLPGLVAGMHLVGPNRMMRFLRGGDSPSDEYGTDVILYLKKFSTYGLPELFYSMLDDPSLAQ